MSQVATNGAETIEAPAKQPTVAEMQAQIQQIQRDRIQVILQQVEQFCRQNGAEIFAMPQVSADGRITAVWGVRLLGQ